MRLWLVGGVLILSVVVLVSHSAQAGVTTEVLVSNTTPTALPANPLRRGLLIENQGPNAIWCAMSSAATVVGKAHRVGPASEAPSNAFPFNAPDAWWCVAETAAQVTGAATVVSEAL
ncbi:hypothetical protein [Myxococcus landrumensis]|uniref:Lipoprotein n=1 Tax=Myxococcus landrumensis TaxID=2813577 RepID=A0ABX7NCJ8_9BACT|nr:hypothetical protein [Myxococcus landrumus]QSQ14033.1 hypothetical protein JY572_37925 [Myxococcus landrumus]